MPHQILLAFQSPNPSLLDGLFTISGAVIAGLALIGGCGVLFFIWYVLTDGARQKRYEKEAQYRRDNPDKFPMS